MTGSTGEGFSARATSAKRLSTVPTSGGRIPIIVHVGAISTLASEDLARHAARAGAAAISSVPPIYWKFSDDQIAAYYSDLVQAAGIPMIVYNVTLAGLVSYEMLLRLGRIEGVEGIKYTSSTVLTSSASKRSSGFRRLFRRHELAVSSPLSARRYHRPTYNVLTPLFLKLNAQMAAGDVIAARETQKIANKLIFALLARGLMPSLKATLTLGGRVDGGISRRPFFQLTEEQHEALKAEYRAIKASHGDLGLDFLKAL
ncbi:MAG: dihydrodipicolinate synthase family protein [Christensenellales bacterium]